MCEYLAYTLATELALAHTHLADSREAADGVPSGERRQEVREFAREARALGRQRFKEYYKLAGNGLSFLKKAEAERSLEKYHADTTIPSAQALAARALVRNRYREIFQAIDDAPKQTRAGQIEAVAILLRVPHVVAVIIVDLILGPEEQPAGGAEGEDGGGPA